MLCWYEQVWVTPLMFVVDWIVGFGEEALMARGVAELSIRRWFSTVRAHFISNLSSACLIKFRSTYLVAPL